MWPSFLYTKGQYQHDRLSAGLFKGELLLRVCKLHHASSRFLLTINGQAFRCIFTSPTSVHEEIADEDANEEFHSRRSSRRSRTCCNVSTLLKM